MDSRNNLMMPGMGGGIGSSVQGNIHRQTSGASALNASSPRLSAMPIPPNLSAASAVMGGYAPPNSAVSSGVGAPGGFMPGMNVGMNMNAGVNSNISRAPNMGNMNAVQQQQLQQQQQFLFQQMKQMVRVIKIFSSPLWISHMITTCVY